MMCLFPANRGYSLDVRRNPALKADSMHSYIKWAVVLQLLIVYTYASIAKLYADWLDFGIIKVLMLNKAEYPIIGAILQEPWIHKIVGVFGIIFDLLIIPALLWKPTRKAAFVASIFFHLFNSVVFQIGIFPYLSLAFTVFFFEPETIRKIFFKHKVPYVLKQLQIPTNTKLIYVLGAAYFLVQLLLPLRHHLIKDDVLWTEEGHRLSWRMMLRSRGGTVTFQVVDKDTGNAEKIDLKEYLTNKQLRRIATYPDFIWQFAQRLKKEYAEKGKTISVYALNSRVSINGKPYRAFIDPKVDLAAAKWNYFWHNPWILPGPNSED